MVKKAVNIEAKAILQLRFNTRKIDKYCSRSNWPASFTIAKSQISVMKDTRIEKFKIWDPELLSGPQHSNELSEKAQKEKKKEYRQKN